MFIARPGPQEAMRPTSQRPAARAALPPLLLLALALLLRLPAFPAGVLDPDEGLYMVQAAAWLRGGWPYIAVWDMHPPGAPALLALVHALVPDPVVALRLAGVLAVGATAILLRAVALRLGGGPGTGFAAGLLYIGHSTMAGGLATNTEILFAPFVTLTALLLLGEALRPAPPRPWLVLAAGLSAGIALWTKQVTALESSALWFTLIVVAVAARRAGPGRVLALALAFALGAGAPSLAVGAGYWLAGNGEAWWQANILAPLTYVTGFDGAPGPRIGLLVTLPLFSALLVCACGVLLPVPAARRAARLLLPWMAAAAVEVAAPGKYYDHYFLILLPPLSLLAAFGLDAMLIHVARPEVRRPAFAAMLALLVAVPVGAMALPRLAHGLGLRGEDPVRAVARAAAGALRPGEALLVANWHAMTYALAGQAPPTRFAFPEHLAGREPTLTGAEPLAELDRVLALPPGVIVLAPTRWHRIDPEAHRRIEAAVARDYLRVATIPDQAGAVEVWRRR
jgi:hypothetical protein